MNPLQVLDRMVADDFVWKTFDKGQVAGMPLFPRSKRGVN